MNSITNSWKSNGKLLLTGEYLVLEGALALAIPLNVGQSLTVVPNSKKVISWQANQPDGHWFYAEFDLLKFRVIRTDNIEFAQKLSRILTATRRISKNIINNDNGYSIITNLEFNPNFGFGTSSTLIANIADWAKVDPYKLLELTFGGSGYDIACANSNIPIAFQRINDSVNVLDVDFDPPFKENLYFVYLGRKQNTADSLSDFKKQCKFTSVDVDAISAITKELLLTSEITEFEALLAEHESIMTSILNITSAKSLYFQDYPGVVKSLGAWGGDFVLITSHFTESKLRSYMQKRGFSTVFAYSNLVL